MPMVIDKVAAVFHYIDGRTEEGYLPIPLSRRGQFEVGHVTLSKEGDVEVFINMAHVISVEQKILYRNFNSEEYSGKSPDSSAIKRYS